MTSPETLWHYISLLNISGLIGIVLAYYFNRKKDTQRQLLQFKYEVVGRSFLPLFTSIDQFCFHSYLICDSREYADPEWLKKHQRVRPGRPANEELLRQRHVLAGYAESLKALKASINRLFESGIPVVINEFDRRAYETIKGVLPFYLSLPTENLTFQDIGPGHDHLRQFSVWMQKRVPIDKLAREYQRAINTGLRIGLGIDEQEYQVIRHKFEYEDDGEQGEQAVEPQTTEPRIKTSNGTAGQVAPSTVADHGVM
jgi:hypothetical protein